MSFDRAELFDAPEAYFDLNGSVDMKLTPSAAKAVCQRAAGEGLSVLRIEGGLWHAPGFEARFDCIWDAADPPIDRATLIANNEAAVAFVASMQASHDVFVITTGPVD